MGIFRLHIGRLSGTQVDDRRVSTTCIVSSSEHTAPDRPRHHRTDSRVARFGPTTPKQADPMLRRSIRPTRASRTTELTWPAGTSKRGILKNLSAPTVRRSVRLAINLEPGDIIPRRGLTRCLQYFDDKIGVVVANSFLLLGIEHLDDPARVVTVR
jgi:hypothetical protein